MNMSATDKTGWTVYEPSRCECVSSRVATIKTVGGAKTVFILDLILLDRSVVLTKYFNVVKTPKGSYSVKHNSDFAKLYRLTLGRNPKARYTRADQLLRHLEGQEFIAEYTDASTSHIDHYFKVTKLVPVNPIITNEWFATGMLKVKKRGQRYNKLNNHEAKKGQQRVGNDLAKVKQKFDNELAMEKAVKPHLNLASNRFSTPLTSLKHDIEPLSHTSTPRSNDEYQTSINLVNGASVYHYHRRSDETESEYHDRVLDESFGFYGGASGR